MDRSEGDEGHRTAISNIYDEGGVHSFLVSYGLNAAKIFPESAIKFMSYETSKRMFAKYVDRVEDPRDTIGMSRFISGGIGGIPSQLETLKTQMMSTTGGQPESLVPSMKRVWAFGSIPAFYRGLVVGLVGVFPYSAIDMSTFEVLKFAYVRSTGKPEPGVLAMLAFGSISRSVGATWVYPLNRVRAPLQVSRSSGVAGSGKSAIAHSVAQRCAHPDNRANLFLSCFLFTLDKPERNSKIFSTIATDLRRTNKQFSAAIADAIEADRSLPSAPISRQFEHLILNPSLLYPPERPVVIVIDALDEGYDEELLKLLQNEFYKLPSKFRVFVTSRFDMKINVFLSKPESVYKRFIDTRAPDNSGDIIFYSRQQLKHVASLRELKEDWPEDRLLEDFLDKADGLFLWAFTALNFIKFAADPEGELRRLVSESQSSHLSPGDNMDELYSKILLQCNWKDRSFAEGYFMLVGAILAAKEPLSINAWRSFYSNVRVKNILHSVGSLLSGLFDDSTPVRILHQSFRDFSSSQPQPRSQPPSLTPSFYIDIKKNSESLALVCLETLNQGLAKVAGLGYLDVDAEAEEVPSIPLITVPEALWYACCYWMDHLADVDIPTPNLVNALELFLENYLIDWMELSAANGRFQNLEKYWEWSKTHAYRSRVSPLEILAPERCLKIERLSAHLSFADKREEAQLAMEDIVGVHRILAAENPEMFTPALARFLRILSLRMSETGHREPALATIEESVTLCRKLARQDPKKFNKDLSFSLNDLSSRLYDLGRHEQALDIIQEAVALRRELAHQHPVKFNPDLASSLHNLFSRLYSVSRNEDALEIIQEAVELRRELARQHPKKFNPDLAASLNNLSLHLSDLGRNEEALEVIQEAVTLRRELAHHYPKKYNHDLARSLNNLSVRLSNLGREEQALERIQEAVTLRRELARQHPKRFNPDLAMSLHNLSVRLSNLGRVEQALATIQEGVALYKELARQHPKRFNTELATSLDVLSSYLSDLGSNEQALVVSRKLLHSSKTPWVSIRRTFLFLFLFHSVS